MAALTLGGTTAMALSGLAGPGLMALGLGSAALITAMFGRSARLATYASAAAGIVAAVALVGVALGASGCEPVGPPPPQVVLVLADTTESCSGIRGAALLEIENWVRDGKLPADVTVGLATFDDDSTSATRWYPLTDSASRDACAAAIEDAIASSPDRGTDVAAGLDRAAAATRSVTSSGTPVVIVVSDGISSASRSVKKKPWDLALARLTAQSKVVWFGMDEMSIPAEGGAVRFIPAGQRLTLADAGLVQEVN